jgi:DNA polymerase III delta prime subunit
MRDNFNLINKYFYIKIFIYLIVMENINLNDLLDRNEIYNKIQTFLKYFEDNKRDLSTKRGIYIYGNPGCGKTSFVVDLLKDMNYDIVKYDAGDIRNKNIIDTITKHNMSDKNVLSMLQNKTKNIAIIMDEIDGMNNGDKGGINSLIKLIRPKKTKKQKKEELTLNPIICISNYHKDKKIKELIKVCDSYELKSPTEKETKIIINKIIPELNNELHAEVIKYIQGDLRKINNIYDIYYKQKLFLKKDIIENIFQQKCYNNDTKDIIENMFNNHYNLKDHNNIINETDRTIVALLWHENIIDVLKKFKPNESFPIYGSILDNICFSDYIDRITFQKQIWQFNEMSSLIKTMYNNYIYHELKPKNILYNPSEVRFTKVLTKYSTEYNNFLFIQNLCNNLSMDKKDLFVFFEHLFHNNTDEEIEEKFNETNITINKLEINRMKRFLFIQENEDV